MGHTPGFTVPQHSGTGIYRQWSTCSLPNGLLGVWLVAGLQYRPAGLQGSLADPWKAPRLPKYRSTAPASLLQADEEGAEEAGAWEAAEGCDN